MSKVINKLVKNNNLITNQVTYTLVFILNEFIDFSETIWMFSIFFPILKIPYLKNIKELINHQKNFRV